MKQRRIILSVVIGVALSSGLLAACDNDDEGSDTEAEATASEHSTYFGWLLGTDDIAAVAIEVDPAGESGDSEVRAYLCDGRGPPEGKAIWFSGSVNAEATQSRDAGATLASAGGDEEIALDNVSERLVQGSFTDAEGNKSQFVAYPAVDGAGIYEVSLDEELHYTGTSTDGDELDAQADEQGATAGTITTADGEELDFSVGSLALATPAELTARGLPDNYSKYVANNQVPGEYVAIIAPGGTHWLGRSGNVRKGSPGANIIGLDKKC